jgi:hypothetical protein
VRWGAGGVECKTRACEVTRDLTLPLSHACVDGAKLRCSAIIVSQERHNDRESPRQDAHIPVVLDESPVHTARGQAEMGCALRG